MAVAALFTSCNSEVDPFANGKGTGRFALTLDADNINVEVEDTRAGLSAEKAANYNICLYQGENQLWTSTKKYSDLDASDYLLGIGTGYSVTAESCTEEEAETTNEGWGCKRYAGKSEPFAIEASKTTPVTVNCTATNGGLCVVFDKSFTDTFGRYEVSIEDERGLKFDATNKSTFDADDNRTGGAVAYYNLPPSGELTLNLKIRAKGAQDVSKTVDVVIGKITRLTV